MYILRFIDSSNTYIYIYSYKGYHRRHRGPAASSSKRSDCEGSFRFRANSEFRILNLYVFYTFLTGFYSIINV